MNAINQGKEIIKQQIRLAQWGEIVRIAVADEANLAVFQQALRSFDIQRMLQQKHLQIEFYFPELPIEQAKKHMLNIINTAPVETREIVFPYLPRDYADAQMALASPEVQQALQRRQITASVKQQTQKPEIIIASYDQIISGELDDYLRSMG